MFVRPAAEPREEIAFALPTEYAFEDVVVGFAFASAPVEQPLYPVADSDLFVGCRHRYVDVGVDVA